MTSSSMDMSLEEQYKILEKWNQTESQYPYDKILPELFEEQIGKVFHQEALTYESNTLTYEDLNSQANQLAHHLRELGVKQNTLVAICMEPCFELLIGILGILKSGGAYIPLDPNNPVLRQKTILSDSCAKILITHSQFANQFEGLTSSQMIYWDAIKSKLATYPTTNPKHINKTNDLAYVIYTSGSTGKPKGVMITHRNVNHFLHWFGKAISISSEDIFDFSSSISFDFSVACTLFPLIKGIKIAICSETDKKDPYLYLRHLHDTHVSIIKITPSRFRQINDIVLSEKKILDLKYIVFGGETLFARDIKDWLKKFPKHKLFCEYGPTEATVASSWMIIDKSNIDQYKHRIPIGKPALNTKMFILDKNMRPVSVGVLGELYIGGNGIAKGYLNKKKLTEKKFVKNPFNSGRLYKTGDLCCYLNDGTIDFVERIDHQIKIRGFRVEIGEIEQCLTSHVGIQNVVIQACSGREEFEEKQLVAYCVPKKSAKLETKDLRDYLKNQLPDYMVPAFFVILNELPLSASGKLDTHKLPQPEAKESSQVIKPRNKIEIILQKIWIETLNLKHISIDDNFFDLGGNSLSAARLITKIRQITHKNILLHDLYHTGTIAHLADVINNAADISDDEDGKHHPPPLKAMPLNELQFLLWLMRLFYPKSKVSNIVARKRIAGNLDNKKLNSIFESLCKNHPILCYRIARYSPLQYPQENILQFKVIEKDISDLKLEEQEHELHMSLDELENYTWKNGSPLILFKLFRLGNNSCEIHIALSHFVSDEISADIVLNEMSHAYVEYKEGSGTVGQQELVFYDYILCEQRDLSKNLSKNIDFWDDYLKNIPLLVFPKNQILNSISSSCTTYFEIPENALLRLRSFCKKNRVGIGDTLIAATGYTLAPYINDKNKIAIINFVKSIRENDSYDKAVGLFVRNDVIKIDLNQPETLLKLAKQVQNSRIEHYYYQSCPAIIKIAFLLQKDWKNKKLSNFLIKLFAKMYTRIFYKYKLNYEILLMFGRVFLARKKHSFFVNINILNHFIDDNSETKLFGFKQKPFKVYHDDKLVEKNVLNIWFDRDEQGKSYLIISGNLRSEFRNIIGFNLLKLIDSCSLHEL
ncbi:non-ribosomal peptide synthetase [Legionella resiliens]|uniref:Amino acid adenylation domain-containing protein n=1 Tax=Legionella resiliens TaxID=2905958 RepID=A0ABS8X425_9GAMM|nr:MULTISPECIES: non-ribosomal peptide synthetase [unclassified Legionella]MCE0724363.1 amino acid adenylation domain-containing protein [Legionella sp. 9fVS26]MCE3533515.1 amino acid adenylation domain-containing protein [Legionella sp. 8cVS16]